jgi:beta-fructofuranosidase
MPCPSGEPVELRLLVDHSIAEPFLTSTGQVLTLRFYPTGEGPCRLQARAGASAGLGFTVDAWDLLPLVNREPGSNASNRRGRSA